MKKENLIRIAGRISDHQWGVVIMGGYSLQRLPVNVNTPKR